MTSTASPEVVPLPDHLLRCACPGNARGRHLTSCAPAREHDATPLSDRPEFEMGRRFQAISWEYPLRLTAAVHVTVEVDPLRYIVEHLADYDAYEMESGYQEWEKPMCFLASRVAEGCDVYGTIGFGFPRRTSSVDSYVDEVSEYPRWGPTDTEHLHAALAAKRVDPNQGTLL